MRATPADDTHTPSGPGAAAPARGAVAAGMVLADRYELLHHVASGGMASVWEATDRVLDRRVAVKILHPHLAADPSFLERFRVEGRAAARLCHAAVVAIFDTVSEHGTEAIVMELVDGHTLRAELDRNGPMTFAAAIALVDQVAAALEAAHDAGIVHRDIKPGNILVCSDHRVKVTDFGIAKAATAADHTTDGALLGTAKYLAPEQVAGHGVDGRADLYSLGVVLYEAITGTVPFVADTPAATALARLEQLPPPVTSRRAGVPPGLVAVIETALARDPAERFASAAALRAALATALIPPPPAVDPTVAFGDDELDPADPVLPTAAGAPVRRVSEPAVVGGGDPVRAVVVGLVILGALVLGLALFAATTVGRDLYGRVRSTITAVVDGGADGPGASRAERTLPVAGAAADAGDRAGSDDPDPDQGTRDAPVVASVVAFDPEGDGTEHSDKAGLVADGDADTTWHSERYDSRQFGNLKSGVGLVVTIAGDRPLERLEVVSPTRGWSGRVFVSDGAAADLTGWGEPIDGRVGVNGTVRFDLRGVVGSHLLVWFTDLGNELPRPRIEVSELAVS